MKRPGCLLKVLADPSLSGLTPGLVAQPSEQTTHVEGHADGRAALSLRLEPRFFPCCDGLGRALDFETQTTRICGLPRRVQAVRDLLTRYHQIWGATGIPLPFDLPVAMQRLALKRLKAHVDGTSDRGILWRQNADKNAPGHLWAVALCAAWRFGMRVHIVNVGRLMEPSYLPADDGGVTSDHRPRLILVEHVDKLWDARQCEELETLISYAYRTATPLWLEVIERRPAAAASTTATGAVPGSPSNSAAPKRTRQAFTQRLGNLKAKPQLSWLTPTARSKLTTMLDF